MKTLDAKLRGMTLSNYYNEFVTLSKKYSPNHMVTEIMIWQSEYNRHIPHGDIDRLTNASGKDYTQLYFLLLENYIKKNTEVRK